MQYCKCGCKILIKSPKKYHSGHSRAVAACKKVSNTIKKQWKNETYHSKRVEKYRKSIKAKEGTRRKKIGIKAKKNWKLHREEMLKRCGTKSIKRRKKLRKIMLARWKSGEFTGTTGLKQSIQSRKKKSLAMSGKFRRGELTPNHNGRGITGRYYSVKCKEKFFYRSLWELEVMKYLEKSKKVNRWDVESLRLPYRYSGKIRTFIVDFKIYLSSGKVLAVEVKPAKMCKILKNKAKIKAARAFCKSKGIRFVVITDKTDIKTPLGL